MSKYKDRPVLSNWREEPPRVSAWVWAADLIGGALLIVGVIGLVFLVWVLKDAVGGSL